MVACGIVVVAKGYAASKLQVETKIWKKTSSLIIGKNFSVAALFLTLMNKKDLDCRSWLPPLTTIRIGPFYSFVQEIQSTHRKVLLSYNQRNSYSYVHMH